MSPIDRGKLSSIRGRLWLGFGVLVGLLVLAGAMVERSFGGLTDSITTSLEEVQTEAQLAGMLTSNVAKTIESGARYLVTRDSTEQTAFRKAGWSAHEVQRQMNDSPNQTALEVAIVASIDSKLSEMEVSYAL